MTRLLALICSIHCSSLSCPPRQDKHAIESSRRIKQGRHASNEVKALCWQRELKLHTSRRCQHSQLRQSPIDASTPSQTERCPYENFARILISPNGETDLHKRNSSQSAVYPPTLYTERSNTYGLRPPRQHQQTRLHRRRLARPPTLQTCLAGLSSLLPFLPVPCSSLPSRWIWRIEDG